MPFFSSLHLASLRWDYLPWGFIWIKVRKKLVGNTGSRNAGWEIDIHFRTFFSLLRSPHSFSYTHNWWRRPQVCMFHPLGRDGRQGRVTLAVKEAECCVSDIRLAEAVLVSPERCSTIKWHQNNILLVGWVGPLAFLPPAAAVAVRFQIRT